jgi:hypothetical protein
VQIETFLPASYIIPPLETETWRKIHNRREFPTPKGYLAQLCDAFMLRNDEKGLPCGRKNLGTAKKINPLIWSGIIQAFGVIGDTSKILISKPVWALVGSFDL